MENTNDLAKATNKIIYELQDYSTATIQNLDVEWEVKTLNGTDILTPKITVTYTPE